MVIVTTFTIEGTIKNNNENLCLVKIHSYQSNTDKTNEAFLTECRYTDENIQVMTNEDGYKEAVEIDNTRKPSTTLSDNRRELLDEIYAKACIKTK